MNRFKPLSAWRDEFQICKASFFSGKQLGKHLFPSDKKPESDSDTRYDDRKGVRSGMEPENMKLALDPGLALFTCPIVSNKVS